MRPKRLSVSLTATLSILAMTVFVTSACAATGKQLYAFRGGADGWQPTAGLILDASGNLYGTTSGGGANLNGTVFELRHKAGGGWTEKVLHTFNGKDGNAPYAGLIFDSSGNLYGTTTVGGAYGDGTVFELMPKAGGGWTEKVLHDFNGKDGYFPRGGLIFDDSGNLYGTTNIGGVYGVGTVFELMPKTGGGWTETVLHDFNNNGIDGEGPDAGLIFDGSGNLYGTTTVGGANLNGTVFELTPKTRAGWTETVLYNFNGADGSQPVAGLIFDNIGNLYGTTSVGGANLNGMVFELTPNTGGGWTETVLHNFNFNGTDGAGPQAGLIFDASSNLYGTTALGGVYGDGTVYELTPKGGGWTETVLHSFCPLAGCTDGSTPLAGLTKDAAGNLYGTTENGGRYGLGTVFEFTP